MYIAYWVLTRVTADVDDGCERDDEHGERDERHGRVGDGRRVPRGRSVSSRVVVEAVVAVAAAAAIVVVAAVFALRSRRRNVRGRVVNEDNDGGGSSIIIVVRPRHYPLDASNTEFRVRVVRARPPVNPVTAAHARDPSPIHVPSRRLPRYDIVTEFSTFKHVTNDFV